MALALASWTTRAAIHIRAARGARRGGARTPHRARTRTTTRADGAAHVGIVSEDLVDGSSLVATRLAPERGGASSSSSSTASSAAASILSADDVDGSSLVATRLAPQSQSQSRSRPPRDPSRPLLYVSPTCPFAQRAWIALLEKDVEHDIVFEDLANKSEDMKAAYALAGGAGDAKVPILVHQGKTMIESAPVADYVAAAFDGGHELLPTTASEEYDGTMFVDAFGGVGPAFFKSLRATNEKEVEDGLRAVRDALKKAETALALRSKENADGPFALGSRYSVYDVVASTIAPRVSIVLRHYRGFSLGAELEAMGLTKVKAWAEACAERPSMRRTLEELERVTGKDVATAFVDHFAKFVSWKGP